jgi:ribosomal protein S18 acetylase RimI-like enzyme
MDSLAVDRPLSIRPTVPKDAEFAYFVLEQTMRAYAEATWGEWREAHAREEVLAAVSDGHCAVIEVDGQAAGILRAIEHPGSHIQLEQLFILPPYQRKGHGSALLKSVIEHARNRNLPVRLRVLKVNPAKSLYERFGFKVTSEEPVRFHMEYAV